MGGLGKKNVVCLGKKNVGGLGKMARILLICAAKKFPMKKVFIVIAVAAAMAACNNSAGADGTASPTAAADSATKMAADSVKAPAADSSSMKMDTASKDTTKKM